MTERERLDADLLELVCREAAAPALSPVRVARARERLEVRLLGAASSAAALDPPMRAPRSTPGLTLAPSKLGAIVTLAFAGGLGLGWGLARATARDPHATSAAVTAPPSRIAEPPASPGVTMGPPASASASATEAKSAQPPSPPRASARAAASADTTQERVLLDQAHRALREGDGGKTLDLVLRHEHDHPNGALVEEREVLRINALLAVGRVEDARASAGAFRRRFPVSPFLPAIESQIRDRQKP